MFHPQRLPPSPSWMNLLVQTLQAFSGNMGVDLCGGKVCVAEHELHTSQVGSVFQQVGGKGVPQGMG